MWPYPLLTVLLLHCPSNNREGGNGNFIKVLWGLKITCSKSFDKCLTQIPWICYWYNVCGLTEGDFSLFNIREKVLAWKSKSALTVYYHSVLHCRSLMHVFPIWLSEAMEKNKRTPTKTLNKGVKMGEIIPKFNFVDLSFDY